MTCRLRVFGKDDRINGSMITEGRCAPIANYNPHPADCKAATVTRINAINAAQPVHRAVRLLLILVIAL
jgi:hypothetical protein